jgi:glycosyltransferase involved in cell wall biosynthesis
MENTTNAEAIRKPLLTFAIVAYNQQDYIREAIEAALAQTYSPLQIILSDDCSPDRTFEIMQEMAAAYSGPHRITLNRNPTNRHIGGHINSIMQLAEGDLVVIAAGDDISVADRVERNFECWDKAGRPAYCSILSAVEHFDSEGALWSSPARTDLKGQHMAYLFEETYGFNGSGHAWTTSNFRLFGDLPEGLVNEDGPIVLRSRLAGTVLFLDEPLVRHRLHNENTGSAGWAGTNTPAGILKYYTTYLTRRELIVRCVAADVKIAEQRQLPNLVKQGAAKLARMQKLLDEEQRLCVAGTLALQQGLRQRFGFLVSCLRSKTAAGRFMKRSLHRVLLPGVFLRVRQILKGISG